MFESLLLENFNITQKDYDNLPYRNIYEKGFSKEPGLFKCTFLRSLKTVEPDNSIGTIDLIAECFEETKTIKLYQPVIVNPKGGISELF